MPAPTGRTDPPPAGPGATKLSSADPGAANPSPAAPGTPPPFEGVMDRGSAPPLPADVFQQEPWLDSVEWHLLENQRRAAAGRLALEPYLLGFATLLAEACTRGRPRVLDFGGGLGDTCLPVLAALPAGAECDYLVVDSPAHVARGRKHFAADPRVRFATTLPPATEWFDLVLASSVLPYVPDWREALGNLLVRTRGWLVLTRQTVAPAATFTARQHIVMTYGPHRGAALGVVYHTFIGYAELLAAAAQAGGRLIADWYYSSYRDALAALPEACRDAHMRTLIFQRDQAG